MVGCELAGAGVARLPSGEVERSAQRLSNRGQVIAADHEAAVGGRVEQVDTGSGFGDSSQCGRRRPRPILDWGDHNLALRTNLEACVKKSPAGSLGLFDEHMEL